MQLNEIHNPHEHASVSLKVLLLIFSVLLVGALGYFTWDYLNTVGTEEDSSLVVGDKEPTEDTNVDNSIECEDPQASEKSYTSQKQGFCFNYPKDWILSDGADTDNGIIWRVSVTDEIIPNSDYPGKFSLYKYKDLTALNSGKLEVTTLEGFLSASATLDDPTYADVEEMTIGGKDGFIAKAGPNQFADGTYYFVENTDKSILVIAVFSDTGEAEIVNFLDSLKIK